MTVAAIAALLIGGAPAVGIIHAQLSIRQQLIIRIPATPARPTAPIEWREKRGPSCIPAAALGGAQVSATDSVDLLLKGGTRIRAKLKDDCGTLTFYSGFYLRPGRDGQVCADRDVIHGRSGAVCEIDSFKTLTPKRTPKR